MLLGALVFVLIYPGVVAPLEAVADYGKKTLPEITKTNAAWWVVPIVCVGGLALWVTRPRKAGAAPQG